jgi:hypothetical protein
MASAPFTQGAPGYAEDAQRLSALSTVQAVCENLKQAKIDAQGTTFGA